jgi:hypothetical protein
MTGFKASGPRLNQEWGVEKVVVVVDKHNFRSESAQSSLERVCTMRTGETSAYDDYSSM